MNAGFEARDWPCERHVSAVKQPRTQRKERVVLAHSPTASRNKVRGLRRSWSKERHPEGAARISKLGSANFLNASGAGASAPGGTPGGEARTGPGVAGALSNACLQVAGWLETETPAIRTRSRHARRAVSLRCRGAIRRAAIIRRLSAGSELMRRKTQRFSKAAERGKHQ